MAMDFETPIYLECKSSCSILMLIQNAIKSIKWQELIFLEFQSIIALNNFFLRRHVNNCCGWEDKLNNAL